MKVVVVSGISGSGKTTFLRALEDIGFFCVDNFPLILLQKFLELCRAAGEKTRKCAFVIDVREREFFDEGKDILKNIKDSYQAEIIFLESSEDVLLRRYKETRRSHPLFATSNVRDALQEERGLVSWIKDMADQVIDSTHLIQHDLRRFVLKKYSQEEQVMKISLISFGYPYGIPPEADMLLDVRFLPNPFFVEGLREKTGLERDVGEFIRSSEMYDQYSLLLYNFLVYLIPLFEREGKSYLTICIGCTGGKHRSVFIVHELADKLFALNYNVSTIHRDIDR
ncbi:MAG TPA: RNase adapter RapZ [Syntrophorhabdaceae bacterium]|nr:RNase adapter RapZ [Syntrophorhabdaceae bacterium]HNT67820.1 RNase adapter RapZ [Syntrophorhabdaceae bacterium]